MSGSIKIRKNSSAPGTDVISGYASISKASPLYDGNTVAWYDFGDGSSTYVTKDGSDFVSVWKDLSGQGNDLLQGNGTNQPLWESDGVLFDGIDNYMKTNPFTLNQPEELYFALKQITWSSLDRFCDGNSNNYGAIFQNVSSPNIEATAGTSSGSNGNLTLDTFGIIKVIFNAANSKFQINETTVIEWNASTSNMGGFTLGSRASTAYPGNIKVKEVIIRNIVDTSADQLSIYNYLKNKYGL